MKKRFLGVLLAPVALLLSACGATPGVVVDRTHTDGYYYYTYYNCGTQQTPMMCPQVNYVPEYWAVIVRQDEDGKTVSSSVTESMYNKCVPGSRWERTSDDEGYCP